MGTYIIRRVLQMIPVLIGATFLIFVMVFALPGDPTDGKCGERPCSPAYIAEFKKEYNLNDNVFLRYAKYTGIWPTEQGGLLQGNLGKNCNGYRSSTTSRSATPRPPSSRWWRSSSRWSSVSPLVC